MLDIKFVRTSPDIIKADLQKRNDIEKIAWVDDLLDQDRLLRAMIQETNELRRRRNTISLDINRAKNDYADPERAAKVILPLQCALEHFGDE